MQRLFILLILVISSAETLKSQDTANILDKVYGLDQTICNGEKYLYRPPPGTKGHQFLLSRAYSDGSITMKGKYYRDLSLNYDIFNQQLLLVYHDNDNAMYMIEVSKAWLQGFSMGGMTFELQMQDNVPRIFQVLGNGAVRLFYYWRKGLEVEGSIGSSNYIFTKTEKDSYVFINGQLRPFNTKRGLLMIFDARYRPEIKTYLRRNRINIRKAPDQVMAEMIRYIDSLR